MTPTEKLLAEQEKIVAERGYYIRPVRMANLMKAASRIFDMLSMGGAFFLHDSLRNDRWMQWVAEELSGRRASRPFSSFTKGMQRG